MQKSNTEGVTQPVSSGQTPISVTQTILTANQIQALSSIRGQQNAIGVLPTGSGANLPTVITLPRAITAASSVPQALHVSGTSLTNTRLISPQTINIIQRQVPTSSLVGISSVTAQGLQQVLQASGTPLTLVTATSPDTAAVVDRERKVHLLQRQREQLLQTGSTVHHLGPKGLANPASNQSNISLVANMSNNNAKQTSVLSGVITTSHISNTSSTVATAKDLKLPGSAPGHALVTGTSPGVGTIRAATSSAGGPLPKRIKIEEKPAVTSEIASLRQNVCGHKYHKMREIKSKYRENLTELFYLQGGGNIVEFHGWKKRPTQPLLSFLEDSKLDSDDDEELQEKRINDEVKVLTSAGSNIPVATPVAISTTLPPSVSALSQQAMNSSTSTTSSLISTPLATATSSELQQHLSRASDVKSIHASKGGSSSGNQHIAAKSIKSQSTSPGRSRQAISVVYENVTGSQDVIERAKQEAKVLQRVNELRKEGLWTAKRLPRVQEPPRQKAHWDYLLEEMTWLAADFIQERKWKKAAAKKIARMVSNYFKEREMKELKAEKEEAIKLKKIASQMSKMVKEFWSNIEKVVLYKQTTRLEEKKKRALDLHLNFIVDQTEKYSSWLTAGLQNTNSSKASSVSADDAIDAADAEFQPMETATDDEETIEKEENEAGDDEDATKKEIEALQKDSELPLEEVLKGLPKEMLDEPSSQLSFDGDHEEEPIKVSVRKGKKKDSDYTASDEEELDEEETLEEQEKFEKDYSHELNDLKAEGEMSVEELMKKYAGAYDSDFEMPDESSEEESNDEDSSGDESENEEEESSEDMKESEEDKDKEDCTEESKKGIGLEYLVEEEKKSIPTESKVEEGPGKEFNDIAAAAQSLQPKGYTLETTEVKTKVPFLLKHTLREYQHVGLDWLATMHDKRLNGILADEMGLGKTIQTIALLAHLACEKGIWGPHLIVVPTSVMLNWEMEIKKWCPSFKILTYYGTIKERKLKRQGWTKTNAFHVCITSYKLVVQDHQAFRRKKWKYFILDEAQNIKNFKSQRWQMLLNFSSQRRLLLTGTPLQNSLMELWSLMHFLMPNVFQSHSEFKEWFSNPLTGMIEGSKEYNESLVRRLHKVLRPFLLRRLKNEVEKQMPQKYEHVVMCRLSKRQRYLYDDFMSQTKTKETLATGHFMSVINILMQLRKVCNHPNLFDPRPIVSPFKMEGIVFNTASLVSKALEYDPFRDIDIYSLYPNLAEMETDLPAFVAQRVKNLQAPGKLIEEVDNLSPPEPRPPKGQLKNFKPSLAAVALQQSDSANQSKASAVSSSKSSTSVQSSQSSSVNSIKLLLPSSSSSSSPSTPQSILIPNPSGSGPSIVLPLPPTSSTKSAASTASSTSVALAQAKLISSQLQSGVLQLVQTSKGHQVITASTSNMSSTSATTSVSTSVSLLKVLPHQKPVMKVSPFVVSSSSNDSNSSIISALGDNKGSSSVMLKNSETLKEKGQKPVHRSELFLESLYRKKEERRRHILSHLAKMNQQRCSVSPVLGSDAHHCTNCFQELCPANTVSGTKKVLESSKSAHNGYCNCLFAQNKTINHFHPDVFWRETCHLMKSVRSPEDHLKELQDILCRFVFVTPTVISPSIQMHVSHPDPHNRSTLDWLESHVKPFIQERSAALHPIQSRTLVQFPEPRLIQYDCGKLQTLDLLLRQLKSGHHRVLIFTQMTKMLDVLEAFLNFHGHRYLRLDGTTKVEQRQYLMDRFNADPRIFCFILSTRSGGIGVNLTGADTVVFYDSDWNPTMDAQAQDRCHRIGQTRDVHIYRLVSEMTVEENILKKANQKRLLGDLAIEGGNFTTAFFKEQTITDLFAEPSGLESLLEEKEAREAAKNKDKQEPSAPEAENEPKKDSKKETAILNQFEQALSKAEDVTDAEAIKHVKAEQKAELAEFDESIPWDEREADNKKEEDEEVSRVELELAMLDKELTPIERYAVTVMEAQLEPETAEELKLAEEDIENSKKDWELARLKALKEEEERKAELEEDEMLYIYSKDESQVKRGRKPKALAKKVAKSSKVKKSSSGSETEGLSAKGINGRRASERLSPIKSPKASDLKKAKKINIVKKKLDVGKKIAKARGRPKSEGNSKKIQGTIKLNAKSRNGPKIKGKAKTGKGNVNTTETEIKKTPVAKSRLKTPKTNSEGATEKKEKPVVKVKTPVPFQNGHSPKLVNSKLSTQARNALLRQQSQQASRIIISKTKSPIISSTDSSIFTTEASPLTSPPTRLPLKVATVKSPTVDPNVPPPWSNPNLVIRTRKAAVHSPVVLSRMQRPPVAAIAVTTAPAGQAQIQPVATPVLQQTLNRLPTSINNPLTAGVRLQGTPDRNIFQLFNTSGITLTPTIRQVAAPAVGQLRGATLINPVSFVNTVNLSGARLITTGGIGIPSSVVVSPTKQPAAPNVAGNVSNITLVPTVLNAGRGQTIINQGPGTSNLGSGGDTRTVLNTARLASPITLQSLGGMPVAVNVIKPNTALTVPVRPQILQTTSLAQVAGQPGYVLITPRPRLSVPSTGVTTVQATSAAPTLQGTRLVLAQMPQAALIQQQPAAASVVADVSATTPVQLKKDP